MNYVSLLHAIRSLAEIVHSRWFGAFELAQVAVYCAWIVVQLAPAGGAAGASETVLEATDAVWLVNMMIVCLFGVGVCGKVLACGSLAVYAQNLWDVGDAVVIAATIVLTALSSPWRAVCGLLWKAAVRPDCLRTDCTVAFVTV